MSVPPSDSPTRTLLPAEPAHPATVSIPPRNDGSHLQTATQPPPESIHYTKPFEGPDSPTSFPTPDDRYVLMSFIARGGMGEVWVAKDRVLNRDVALKLLRDDLATRKFSASRFIEEARITGKLQHPSIPPIHDLGTLRDGRPFIAMKLIKDGRTLSDLLANDTLDVAERLRIFEDVCHAVSFAHDRRVIHRDLKPGNVMVGSFNEVQVMDWGLAKVLGEASLVPDSHSPAEQQTQPPVSVIESDRDPSSHTKAGSLLGTPAYMPPEQAKGEVARTDVFALGAMLCELLTGQPPYWATTSAEIQALAVIGQIGPAFERLDTCGADAELIALAKRCLQTNPDDRPFDAKQVANAVTAYRDGVEDRLRRAERERAAAEAKAAEEVNTRREADARRRVQLWLAAAAATLVLGIGVAAWWTDHQANEQRRIEAEKQAEVDRLEAQRVADADRAKIEREQRAVRNVEAIGSLLDEVNAALKADDAEKAAIPFALAEKRAAEGNAEAVAGRIVRAREDLAMLRMLDTADDKLWTAEDYKTKATRSAIAWEAAFKSYGIDPMKTPVEESTRRVNDSVLRERLILTLDLWWLFWKQDGSRRPPELRKLILAIDPDSYRNEFRTAHDRGDASWFDSIASDPRLLNQPPRFAAVIGHMNKMRSADRERVLRPALERNPGNFTLILSMITALESEAPYRLETSTQQLRWAQAAVSVRPNSKVAWRSLGRAYWDKGQIEDAVRCYKRAVRLDPNDYNSHSQLSAVMLRKHDPEAALEAADRALAINSEYAYAHSARGSVLQRMNRFEEAEAAFDRAIELETKNGYENHTFFNNRGYARYTRGNLVGAIADFKAALRVKRDFQLADTNLDLMLELRKNGRPLEPAPPPREVKP